MQNTHSIWGRAGSFCLPIACSGPRNLTASSTHPADLSGDDWGLCSWPWVAGGRLKLVLVSVPTLGVPALLVSHAQPAACQVLITLVSGVAAP